MQRVGADVEDAAASQFIDTLLAFGIHRPLAVTESMGF